MTSLRYRAPAWLVTVLLVVTYPFAAHAAEARQAIDGRVLDGRMGQPIEKAKVETAAGATTTDRDGRFSLALPTSDVVEITVSAVGYRVLRRRVTPGLAAVDVSLAQDALAYDERVEVRPGVFEAAADAPLGRTLQNVELRNLSSVVADDVLRAVQTLPGVTAGDDFYGTFALRGWGFENTGLYIDGVLLEAPFHTIRDLDDAFSLTILNNDLIDGATLLSGAPPARFGDRVGGTLDLSTREGSATQTSARASLGATGATLVADGPLGASGASWLVGARKSFLDYVVKAIDDQSSFVLGYSDIQAKVSRRTGAHAFSLFLLHGKSNYEDGALGLPRNDVAHADAATQLLNARWAWTPSAKTTVVVAAFGSREAGDNRNAVSETLFDAVSGQVGGRVDVTRTLRGGHALQSGVWVRRLSSEVTAASFGGSGAVTATRTIDASRWQPSGYLHNDWTSRGASVQLSAGVRFDGATALDATISPRASGRWRWSARNSASFALGHYRQFPTLVQFAGATGLVTEESDHYTMGLEHRLSSTLRAEVQAYSQQERNRLGRSHLEPRLVGGRLVLPPDGPLRNSWSGTSRGVEVSLQRRSPNGLTGWVSYALAHARLRDGVTGSVFDGDFDQRHAVNTYLSYRVSHRTNVSAKYRFGSNTPIAGYLDAVEEGWRVGSERNRLRLPAYSRLDLRANRTFTIRRSRLTVHAEAMNVLNQANFRYTGRSVFLPSGRVTFSEDTLFPFLPAVGATLEW